MRKAIVVVGLVVSVAAPALAQEPPVQNGRVETRQAADVAREVGAIASASGEPTWIGWRAAMVPGPRSLCNWYVDDQTSVRGFLASSGQPGEPAVPHITPPTGPVPIEAGTGLVVLLRVANGAVERLRTLTDDCPIDAGGRAIHWLEGITPARSVTYLTSLTVLDGLSQLDRTTANTRRSLARSAVTAIALHDDASAGPALDRLMAAGTDDNLRRHVVTQIGTYRGATGFQTLARALETETDATMRRVLVTAIAQGGQPAAVDLLGRLAESDADARLRAEAAGAFARLAGEPGVTRVLSIIARDEDDAVKRRAIQGLAHLPDGAGVPHLITLARSSDDAAVRREAVSALGTTKDARAVAYLTEILAGRGR